MLTHLSLFSGIGGLDIAAEWAGFTSVGQCEWADYPTKVLEKHWPDVPRWRDIRTLTGDDFYARTGLRTVDVLSGGFPCQPFSVAGKRRGKEDDRYLWPEMLRVIEETRPRWVVGENVAGIVNMALDQVLSDLEAQGYETRAFVLPACGVDAPHRRDRVAIVGYAERSKRRTRELSGDVAYRQDAGWAQTTSGAGASGENGGVRDVANTKGEGIRGLPIQPGEPRQACDNTFWRGEDVADAKSAEFLRRRTETRGRRPELRCGGRRTAQPGLGGVADGFSGWLDGYWDIEPDIPRTASGIPNRVDRLKCLGNAVVPQQFYPVFRAIAEIENSARG